MRTPLASIVMLLVLSFRSPVWAEDLPRVVRQTTERATHGNADAQLSLGVMYANGQGVPQDYAVALKWFRLAAAQGNAAAQYNLGLMYDAGHGVPQDYTAALKWYRLAAAQGDAAAEFNLGAMYSNGDGVPQDDVQAYTWFTRAAANAAPGTIRDKATSARDLVATHLTPAQMAEAQKLARER
jgi:TPR repeat protein